MDILQQLYDTVLERKGEKQEGSYTCYLFEQGLDKILKSAAKSAAKSSSLRKTAKKRTPWAKSATCSITSPS